MTQRPVLESLRCARIRGPSGMWIYTDWQDVPEGFAPDHLSLSLDAAVGTTFVTAALHNRPPALHVETGSREAEVDALEHHNVLVALQVSNPGASSGVLCVDTLSGKARVRVDLVGGWNGRVDVVLSAKLYSAA